MPSNYSLGHDAEARVADYLATKGFKIVQINWKTKYCEIDIVAQEHNAVYFVEVKSRSSNRQGYGAEYVTPKKLKQMQFAASMWVNEHKWQGEYQLAVVSVDGDEITLIDDI